MKILECVRDQLHQGHKLLTHPLSGSLKPNETPCKSIAISDKKGSLDLKGLSIVEESIASAVKFINNKPLPQWKERILKDFELIDFSLIEGAIRSMNGKQIENLI